MTTNDPLATKPPRAPQAEDHLRFGNWEQRYSFCLNVATMVRAGIPLAEAISYQGASFRAMDENKAADVCDSLAFRISSGQETASQAVASLPRAFPKYIQRIIQAGSSIGKFDVAFEKAAEVEKNAQEARKEIRDLLKYPIVILLFSGIVGVVLLDSLAALLPLFESSESEIQKYIQGALALSESVQDPVFLGVSSAALALVGWRFWRDERLRRDLGDKWHHIFRNFPGLKGLILLNSNVQFCYVLARQLEVGVVVTVALEPALLVANDPHFDEISASSKRGFKGYGLLRWLFRILGLTKEREPKRRRENDIETCIRDNGDSLGEALERYPELFLPQVVAMVKLGEEAGSLPLCLRAIARVLEIEMGYRSTLLKSLIQPIVMLVSGLLVLAFAYVSLMPMMQTLQL